MIISRREALAGLGAGLLLAGAPPRAQTQTMQRRFAILRDGEPIGQQILDVRSGDDGRLQVAVDIELSVQMLGITAYRYEMSNRELWRGGRLRSMRSETDDDGDKDFVRVKYANKRLEIDASGHQGAVPPDAVSTTYWSPAFLNRKTWINSQTGVPIHVSAAALPPGEVDAPIGAFATDRWRVTGENLDIVLHYVGGEWVSVEFDARGKPAHYLPEDMGSDLWPVWESSL